MSFTKLSYKKLTLALICSSCTLPGMVSAVDNFYNMHLGNSGVTLSPGGDIKTGYNDNIFTQEEGPGRISSWKTEINPYLSFHTKRNLDLYEFRYTLNAGFYDNSSDDNYDDHMFAINTHNVINKKNQFDIHASYNLLHEDRGSGISDGIGIFFTEPDEYTDAKVNAKYLYGTAGAIMNVELAAGYLDKEYTNHEEVTQYFDRDEPNIGATLFYRVMPKTQLLFQIRHKQINYDIARPGLSKIDSKQNNYQFGVTWQATAKTKGIFKIGRLDKNFDASAYEDYDFTSWNVGVDWNPRKNTRIYMGSTSDAEESYGTGLYTEAQRHVIAWTQNWNSRVESTVDYHRDDLDYIASTRDDSVDNIGFNADYKITPEIKLGMSYDYEERDSSREGRDYTNNIFMLYGKIGY